MQTLPWHVGPLGSRASSRTQPPWPPSARHALRPSRGRAQCHRWPPGRRRRAPRASAPRPRRRARPVRHPRPRGRAPPPAGHANPWGGARLGPRARGKGGSRAADVLAFWARLAGERLCRGAGADGRRPANLVVDDLLGVLAAVQQQRMLGLGHLLGIIGQQRPHQILLLLQVVVEIVLGREIDQLAVVTAQGGTNTAGRGRGGWR